METPVQYLKVIVLNWLATCQGRGVG